MVRNNSSLKIGSSGFLNIVLEQIMMIFLTTEVLRTTEDTEWKELIFNHE